MGKQSKNNNKNAAKNSQPTEEVSNPTRKEPSGPPVEISQEEYQDLLSQVAELALEDLQDELLQAARYGDIDVGHAILSNNKDNKKLLDYQEPQNGSTPMHMAAANGHTAIVQLLLANGASHFGNKSGNTPLHWAAANGHDVVVAELLASCKDIDVLSKNNFGRSALTEGFSSQKTEVVKHLLEHDSAAEEKLLQGTNPTEVDEDDEQSKENNNENKSTLKKNSVVHEFDFSLQSTMSDPSATSASQQEPGGVLQIRELPIAHADDPFGQSPEADTTGYGIWAASLVMARWMAVCSDRFQQKTVLELGAGCGVPGLSAAFYSDAKQVYVTDLNPETVENLEYNVKLNQKHTLPSGASWIDRVHASSIDWDDTKTWPDEKIDFVIGSDLIYQASIVPILQKVVLGLCRGQGTFLYVAPDTDSSVGRDGLAQFIATMKATEGCELVSETLAPKEYHANPLANKDDDECFLHFHELSSCAYKLYEFKMSIA